MGIGRRWGRSSARTSVWSAGAACAAVTGLNWLFLTLNRGVDAPTGLGSDQVEALMALAYLAMTLVGCVALVRRPGSRVGRALRVGGLALATAGFASEYSGYALLTEPGSLPAGSSVAWLGSWLWWTGAGVVLRAVFLPLPEDGPGGRLDRVAGQVTAAGVVVLGLVHALTPGPLFGEFAVAGNPLDLGAVGAALRPVRDHSWVLLAGNTVVALVALARRPRSPGEPWRPLWAVGGCAAAVLAAMALWATTRSEDAAAPVVDVLFGLAAVAIPGAAAAGLARAATLQRSVASMSAARDAERERLRSDLHDGLGPVLTAVALRLDALGPLVVRDAGAAAATASALAGEVRESIEEVRRLVDGLSTSALEDRGLEAAVRAYARSLPAAAPVIEVSTAGDLRLVPREVQVAAYRIATEAVTNAVRHGSASTCSVRLELADDLSIVVSDDGRGLAPDAGAVVGFGLVSMRRRAAALGGTLAVGPSSPGTTVTARLPVEQ